MDASPSTIPVRTRSGWVAASASRRSSPRMKFLAARAERPRQTIDFFHTTSEYDGDAIAKLTADAAAAGVRLHVLIDSRDGRLDGERIRALVPEWRDASVWFCGPTGFGQALRHDFAAHGLPVDQRFHQELFAMR